MAGKKLDEQMEKTIRNNYRRLTGCLIDRKMTITTMESITCGQIASLITDTEGASAVLKGGVCNLLQRSKDHAGCSGSCDRNLWRIFQRNSAGNGGSL